MNSKPLQSEIALISHQLYNQGLVPGKSGNISMRKEELIGITPSGVSLRDLKEDDVVIVDLEGKKIQGNKPSSELDMHLSIYNERNDVYGIVHTHSPYATGFAMAGEKIKRLEGFGPITNSNFQMIKYYVPGSSELAENTGKGLLDHDVLILESHGIVTVANNLKTAALLAEWVEATAKTMFVYKVLKK